MPRAMQQFMPMFAAMALFSTIQRGVKEHNIQTDNALAFDLSITSTNLEMRTPTINNVFSNNNNKTRGGKKGARRCTYNSTDAVHQG
mmetsp:Transcript_3146/g.4254  ORF Transcript_3146/g.4254 Transcript_3146/m.4254 type:complete len:87 (-) Transcript_3146:301-561(-)